jgi:hypothetical protein
MQNPIYVLDFEVDGQGEIIRTFPTGIIDDYSYIGWTRKYYRPDEFEIRINRNKSTSEKLELYSVILFNGYSISVPDQPIKTHEYMTSFTHLQLQDTTHSNPIFAPNSPPVSEPRIGVILSREVSIDENGKGGEVWIIRGKTIDYFFEQAYAFHDTVTALGGTGSGYDEQTGEVDTVMMHYVNENILSPSGAAYARPLFSLGIDTVTAPSVSIKARFQSIAEILETCCVLTDWGYKMAVNPDTFDGTGARPLIFQPYKGADVPVVKFSPDLDNIRSMKYSENIMNFRERAFIFGQGEGLSRYYTAQTQNNYNGLPNRPLYIFEPQLFVDARDIDNDDTKLQSRGTEKLKEFSDVPTMEFENTQTGQYQYLIDYNLGDKVRAYYYGVAEMSARIIEIREEYTPEGFRHYLTVGASQPNISKALKQVTGNFSPETRR